VTLRIAINGFGRIGRMVLRALAEAKCFNGTYNNLEIVSINDLGPAESNAHLLRYDSVHGRFPFPVSVENNKMKIGGPNVGMKEIILLKESDPNKLPWAEQGIDLVFECTGRFTKRQQAEDHLKAGAKKVLVSAPAEGADITVVYGVNHKEIKPEDKILSNASCTTNCLAPIAKVLDQAVGIECGYMTTIHAYTGDQRLVDTLHSDMHRARAAALSMIPSSTGAAKAVGLVLPQLKGKLDGTAIRVPTSNVSVVDLKFNSRNKTTKEELNEALKIASNGELKGVLSTNILPLVSCDFNHDPSSSTADLTQTQVIGDNFCRVLSWYDNEWGFSNRMLDVASYMAGM